jgi:glycosyltransferase involved in cell wall biosynthesis
LAAVRGKSLLAALIRAGGVYPRLLIRALAAQPFDAVMISTGGFPDIVLGWLLARLTGTTLIFDPLYGLWETIVEDRRLVSERSVLSRAIWHFELLCWRLADVMFVDTHEHREYFARMFGLARRRMLVVPVGADETVFRPRPGGGHPGRGAVGDVLFYGWMIPLHGAEHIVEAASQLRGQPIRLTLIGQGQTGRRVRELAEELACDNIDFVDYVPYADLPERIARADVCLGIFGRGVKCSRVVPNKVFQCLAMGKAVITGDTPAIRRAFKVGGELLTVPSGDSKALAEAIACLCREDAQRESLGRAGRKAFVERFSVKAISKILRQLECRWL